MLGINMPRIRRGKRTDWSDGCKRHDTKRSSSPVSNSSQHCDQDAVSSSSSSNTSYNAFSATGLPISTAMFVSYVYTIYGNLYSAPVMSDEQAITHDSPSVTATSDSDYIWRKIVLCKAKSETAAAVAWKKRQRSTDAPRSGKAHNKMHSAPCLGKEHKESTAATERRDNTGERLRKPASNMRLSNWLKTKCETKSIFVPTSAKQNRIQRISSQILERLMQGPFGACLSTSNTNDEEGEATLEKLANINNADLCRSVYEVSLENSGGTVTNRNQEE